MLCPECGARNLPEASECVACGDALPVDPADDIDPLIGTRIAHRYTLTGILGEGSMGVVYAAGQEGLDHEVAVKVLHEHVAADPKVKQRFHREARMTSRLSHPNTVRVFDFGRTDTGQLYLAMELLDGPDLLELLEEDDPLTPRRIVDLLVQTLNALEEAHDEGIVHRDLKPENVMVVQDHQGRERVKVCDFGIAKLVEAEGTAITVTGFVCGTPEYMAPEQARGDAVGPPADIYAMGCLLYRMLTGVVPFQGKSALGTITLHLTQALERPRRRAPDRHIPRALDGVCVRALAKDPARRYPDAASMRDALEASLEAMGAAADEPLGAGAARLSAEPSIPVGAMPPHRPWLVPAVGLTILAILGGALALTRSGTSREEPAASSDRDPMPPPPADSDPDVAQPAPPQRPPIAGPGPEEGPTPTAATSPTAGGMAPSEARQPPVAPTTRPRRESLESQPPSAYGVHFEEGRRLFLANDVAAAIDAFEAAARAAPSRPGVYKELGRAQMRTGDIAAARAAYRRYLELAPDAADRAIVERLLGSERP